MCPTDSPKQWLLYADHHSKSADCLKKLAIYTLDYTEIEGVFILLTYIYWEGVGPVYIAIV